MTTFDTSQRAVRCPPSKDYDAASHAQAIAADPAHPVWVNANAGSGKTKVLIDRVARLLLKGASPDSILCVTYTKAAANEMLQRLFDRLGSWSVMEEAVLRKELTELERRSENPYTDDEIRKARALFARALETPGGLRIETIHAFCARLLRRFPLEAKVAPGFNEIDEIEAESLWQLVLEEGLIAADRNNPELLDAVAYEGGGLGAMAGLDIARNNAAKVLAFSDQNRNEPAKMDAALRAALSPPDQNEEELIRDGMILSLPTRALGQAVEILEKDGKPGSKKTAEHLRELFAAPTPEEKWAIYRSLFFTQAGPLRKNIVSKPVLKTALMTSLFQTGQTPVGTEVQRAIKLDADIKAARIFARTRALLLLSAPLLTAYREQKRARAAIDFDDLIALTYALLTRSDVANWVLYKLDGGLTHVLLDEAQDTSPDQWGLLNALTSEFFAGQGVEKAQDPRTLFVVGDEKQSIYSFQGADPQRFLNERQVFEQKSRAAFGKAELPEMAMSFRSSPEILSFVDKLSECGNDEGHPYLLGPVSEANLSRHTARRANQPGSVELWPIDVPEPEADAIPWEAPRDTQSASNPKNRLAEKVGEEIDALLERGDQVWAENRDRTWQLRPANAGDILILVNKRTGGLFDALIDALKTRNIPVAGADRLILADHIGVQDCLNLVRFVLLPGDDLTLAEILRGPFGNLIDDDRHLFPLAYARGDLSLWQRLQQSEDPDHKSLVSFLDNLMAQAHLPAYEFLSYVLTVTGPKGLTGWQQLAERLGPPMRDPVQALLARAMDHDAKSAASLQGFVARMDLDRSQIKRDLAAPNGEVRVMTVHGAKGLQAPIVILPDTTGAPNPVRPSIIDMDGVPVWISSGAEDTPVTALARENLVKRSLREHRRLLYVALTRAQDRLMIFGAWSGHKPKVDSNNPPGDGFAKESWYALCSEAMTKLLGNKAQADSGRPAFCRFGEAAPSGQTLEQISSPDVSLPEWLHKSAPGEVGTRHVAAPSALVPGETPVLPPLGVARAARLRRGRLIHALLERLPALPPDTREAAGEAFLARDTVLSNAERQEILRAAMGVLTDPAFAEVFAEGGRAEAAVIGTSPNLPQGLIINGRVDRLVVSPTQVLIIDFKTDRPPPSQAENVASPYLAQMAAYASILVQAYPDRQIRAALVWTEGPKLMELPPALLARALSQTSVPV